MSSKIDGLKVVKNCDDFDKLAKETEVGNFVCYYCGSIVGVCDFSLVGEYLIYHCSVAECQHEINLDRISKDEEPLYGKVKDWFYSNEK